MAGFPGVEAEIGGTVKIAGGGSNGRSIGRRFLAPCRIHNPDRYDTYVTTGGSGSHALVRLRSVADLTTEVLCLL